LKEKQQSKLRMFTKRSRQGSRQGEPPQPPQPGQLPHQHTSSCFACGGHASRRRSRSRSGSRRRGRRRSRSRSSSSKKSSSYQARYERCVKHVKRRQPATCRQRRYTGNRCYNPWAVCRASVKKRKRRASVGYRRSRSPRRRSAGRGGGARRRR
jgi:hypothetical protein